MQGNLGLVGRLDTGRQNLPWEWVELCSSPQQAARLCIEKARIYRNQGDLAEILNVDRSHLNTMLNSKEGRRVRNMPLELIEDLQDLCGNNAINQWQELYRKKLLRCQKDLKAERAKLLEQLALLDKQEQERL